MDLLPYTFKDELIAEMFLDSNGERASATLEKCHNAHRILNPKDFSSSKGFVWLNDTEHVRLNWGLFCWTGLRLCAPIKEIYLLRDRTYTEDYTTLSRAIVDITRVTWTGETKVSQKIQVGVISIRPPKCIMNSSSFLIKSGTLPRSKRRCESPVTIPDHVSDVTLWKLYVDKGGGCGNVVLILSMLTSLRVWATLSLFVNSPQMTHAKPCVPR